jgi:Predicted transcriptional regulators
MDNRTEVRDFLRTRRAKITPDQANIIGGGHRRVPGLRREEVAMLACVSVDYYARLERGDLSGVSEEVLVAVAGALQLDEAESAHLYDLARAAQPTPIRRRRPTPNQQVRPSLQRFLDSIAGSPTWIRNRHMDMVATNPLGRALYAPVLSDPENRPNNAKYTFLNPEAKIFYTDWDRNADDLVATLRTYAGQNPRDRALTNLIGELVTAATSSAHAGPPTMSVSTAPASNAFTTLSSANSNSSTRQWNCPTIRDGPCSPIRRNLVPRAMNASGSSAAGPPPTRHRRRNSRPSRPNEPTHHPGLVRMTSCCVARVIAT